jgi:phosphoadenosine phosphosulfate reductase
MQERVKDIKHHIKELPPEEILSWFRDNFTGKLTFSTSLSAEDQVIIHMLAILKTPARIFTLDTGRLFQETYDLLDITLKKFGLPIDVYFPDANRVEEMVRSKGINLFYESIENRQLCCHIRKIEPLRRALAGMDVWITGMRKEQSVTRNDSALIEWDPVYEIIKVNPLIHWTSDMVWQFVRSHNIPVNELHSKGYPSIGCLPCTRAVEPGEDVRSGRWWWELPEFRECGLHKKH